MTSPGQPLLWARQADKGRVFVSIPGHYTWTFDDPLFRVLLLRGIAWTAGESVERLRNWASGRCLSADRPGVYTRVPDPTRTNGRKVPRDPSQN